MNLYLKSEVKFTHNFHIKSFERFDKLTLTINTILARIFIVLIEVFRFLYEKSAETSSFPNDLHPFFNPIKYLV